MSPMSEKSLNMIAKITPKKVKHDSQNLLMSPMSEKRNMIAKIY